MGGFLVADRDDFVENVAIQYGRNEAGTDALNLVIARLTAGDDRRRCWLDGADSYAFHFFFEHFADAGDCAAGADPGDEGIDALELFEQLLRGGFSMHVRVGRIVKLLRHVEVAVLLEQLFGFVYRATHAFGVRGENQMRAIRREQAAPFLAHGIGHGQDQFVAFDRGNQSQPDSGVAASGLDNRRAGFNFTLALGAFDHIQADAIFDRSARIEGLHFGPHFGVFFAGKASEFNHRGGTDQIQHRPRTIGACHE